MAARPADGGHPENFAGPLQQIADEHAALRRVALLVARSATSAEVFAEVASEVRELLGADVTTIARFEPDATATILAGVGTNAPLAGRWPVEPPLSIAEVFRTGRPARVDDFGVLEGGLADYARREGLRSSVASPIQVGGRSASTPLSSAIDSRKIPGRSG